MNASRRAVCLPTCAIQQRFANLIRGILEHARNDRLRLFQRIVIRSHGDQGQHAARIETIDFVLGMLADRATHGRKEATDFFVRRIAVVVAKDVRHVCRRVRTIGLAIRTKSAVRICSDRSLTAALNQNASVSSNNGSAMIGTSARNENGGTVPGSQPVNSISASSGASRTLAYSLSSAKSALQSDRRHSSAWPMTPCRSTHRTSSALHASVKSVPLAAPTSAHLPAGEWCIIVKSAFSRRSNSMMVRCMFSDMRVRKAFA